MLKREACSWQCGPTSNYTKTFERTNTGVFPYASTTNADRIGFQLQMNY